MAAKTWEYSEVKTEDVVDIGQEIFQMFPESANKTNMKTILSNVPFLQQIYIFVVDIKHLSHSHTVCE